MVCIAFQDDVKKSFSKVKGDILNLKRSINRELLAIDEIGGRLNSYVQKEEFYTFIKRLGERLDKIDSSLAEYLGYGDDIKANEGRVRGLSRKLARQEDLGSEIKEIRKLKGKLASLEGSSVDVKRFNEGINRLVDDISSLRKEMLTDKSFQTVKTRVSEVAKRIDTIEKSAASKDEVSLANSSVDELRRSVDRISADARAKSDESAAALRKDLEKRFRDSASKAEVDRALRSFSKELSSVRGVLERSVSEVDIADYVERKELEKRLSRFDEVDAELQRLSGSVADFRGAVDGLRKDAAFAKDIDRISADVREVSSAVDSLKAAIEKTAGSAQKQFDRGLSQFSARMDRELSKMRSEFDSKLRKLPKEPAKRKGDPGIVARVGRNVADFFREEDVPKKEEKRKVSVAELIDDEKKRKDTSFWGLFIILGVAALVVAGGIFLFVSQNTPVDVVPVTEEPVLNESGSNASVTAPPVGDGNPVVRYILAVAVSLAVLLGVYFFVLRAPRKGEGKKKESNGVDLGEFFHKK